jgi:asparagine synthase (glutamine-hydrolysing)
VRAMRGSLTRDACYWLSSRLLETVRLRRAQSLLQHGQQVRSFGQRQLLDILADAFSTQVMERVEREGAHSGIEMRYPLRSPHIVQYAFSTPERLRLRGDWTKAIHRQALQGFMPPAILERKSKAEFSVIFRAHLDQMQEALTRSIPRERADWVDPDGIAQLFRFYQGNSELGWPLWILWAIYACDKSLQHH